MNDKEHPESKAHDDPPPREIARDIAHTRAQMSETLAEIEQRLNPTELREKAVEELHVVEVKVKEAVKEQFEEAKAKVKEELTEAKDSAKQQVKEAFQQAKQEVKEAFNEAGEALRDATIGKVETMARRANDAVMDTSETIISTIRANPIPAALTGLGLLWLFMNRTSSSSIRVRYTDNERPGRRGPPRDERMMGDVSDSLHRAQHAVSDTFHRAQETVGHAVHDAQERASHLAHQATDAASSAAQQVSHTASDLAHRASDMATDLAHRASDTVDHVGQEAREQARRVEDTFRDSLDSNPLALGAVAVALGTVVGLSLPRTRREDELLGEARDQLVDRAQEMAHGAFETAHQYTGRAAEQVKGALQPGH